MKHIFLFSFLFISIACFSQNDVEENVDDSIKPFSEKACNCIDSLKLNKLSTIEIAEELSGCIDEQVVPFMLLDKLSSFDVSSGEDQEINFNPEPNSKEYKKYYYNLERELMDNCASMAYKVNSNEEQSNFSVSEDPEAIEFYNKGIKLLDQQEFEKAIAQFYRALEIDENFAFAWDNIGVAYRKLGKLDEAIDAYTKSLLIEPSGTLPIQNLAVVYQYKEEYENAIEMYNLLAKKNEDDPEVYYGLGHIYLYGLKDYEKALRNMCMAYNIYIDIKSPYRTDAEQAISAIYQFYESDEKVDEFNNILKEYNITQE